MKHIVKYLTKADAAGKIIPCPALMLVEEGHIIQSADLGEDTTVTVDENGHFIIPVGPTMVTFNVDGTSLTLPDSVKCVEMGISHRLDITQEDEVWVAVSSSETVGAGKVYSRYVKLIYYNDRTGNFESKLLSPNFTFGEQDYEVCPDYHTPDVWTSEAKPNPNYDSETTTLYYGLRRL